jgi:hypothetical protein
MSSDEKKLAIISALAGDIIEELKAALEDITPFITEKVQFLVDADLIEVEEGECFVRSALHVAIDFALEDELVEDDDCDDTEDSCCACGQTVS